MCLCMDAARQGAWTQTYTSAKPATVRMCTPQCRGQSQAPYSWQWHQAMLQPRTWRHMPSKGQSGDPPAERPCAGGATHAAPRRSDAQGSRRWLPAPAGESGQASPHPASLPAAAGRQGCNSEPGGNDCACAGGCIASGVYDPCVARALEYCGGDWTEPQAADPCRNHQCTVQQANPNRLPLPMPHAKPWTEAEQAQGDGCLLRSVVQAPG